MRYLENKEEKKNYNTTLWTISSVVYIFTFVN